MLIADGRWLSRLSIPLNAGGEDIVLDNDLSLHQAYEFPVSPTAEGHDLSDRATPLKNDNALGFKFVQNAQAVGLEFGCGECLSLDLYGTCSISYHRLHSHRESRDAERCKCPMSGVRKLSAVSIQRSWAFLLKADS